MAKVACAREPYFREEGDHYEMGIVFCDTDSYQPPVMGDNQRHGRCLRHGGRSSWQRCSTCPDAVGRYDEKHRTNKVALSICNKGDLNYDFRNNRCRNTCAHHIACIHNKIESGARIVLVRLAKR